MRKKKWIFVAAPIGMLIFIVIGGEVVMHLWNWLVPELFGWQHITFWQAIGLLALCRILFGGFGLRGCHSRRRMSEYCSDMTPEEREKLRQGLHGRWGHEPPPDSKPTV